MSKPKPFKIGDIVYIIGKYVPDPSAPVVLLECKIDHIKRKQFVAYSTDDRPGEWIFSNKHYNYAVFKDKAKAIKAIELYEEIGVFK